MYISHSDLLRSLHYNPLSGVFKWAVATSKTEINQEAGYIRSDGYRYIQINGRQYLAHRLAWFYVYKEWPPNQIDHKDRNRSNNKLSNLRLSDHSLNAKNRTQYKNNTAGSVGIYYEKRLCKWRAMITVDGKTVNLGSFGDRECAIKARQKAEVYFGFY